MTKCLILLREIVNMVALYISSRFGHVNPRPTDKIPPLNYKEDSKETKENGFEEDDDNGIQRTPIPPL